MSHWHTARSLNGELIVCETENLVNEFSHRVKTTTNSARSVTTHVIGKKLVKTTSKEAAAPEKEEAVHVGEKKNQRNSHASYRWIVVAFLLQIINNCVVRPKIPLEYIYIIYYGLYVRIYHRQYKLQTSFTGNSMGMRIRRA